MLKEILFLSSRVSGRNNKHYSSVFKKRKFIANNFSAIYINAYSSRILCINDEIILTEPNSVRVLYFTSRYSFVLKACTYINTEDS